MSRTEELDRFVELSEWIRELSSPQVEGIRTPEEYRKRFVRNFARIYELSRTSTEILKLVVFPLLEAERPLTDDETKDLFYFVSRLLDAVNIECVDVPLRGKVIDRLLRDAEEKDDIRLVLRALDARIETCYFMMNSVSRTAEVTDMMRIYRETGLSAAEQVLSCLDKEQFAALPDHDTKEIVLINSRYVNALYDYAEQPAPKEFLQKNFDAMVRALKLADDPFFIDQASKYNWKNHIFRALQGIAFMTEYANKSGVPDDMLPEINRYTRQMVALWKRDKVSYGALCAPETLYLNMYRNAFLTGEIPLERFRKELLDLGLDADAEDFTHDGNMNTICTMTEYILTLDKEHLTNEQKAIVTRFYIELPGYVHRMPKLGSLTFLLVYLKHALDAFIEFEGGPDYEELLLKLLAGVLPQVYLHSVGVAGLSRILARRLFFREPERFALVPGYPDGEAVADYCYHAGLLHDIGKLMVAEYILTYSRDRFEEEITIYGSVPEIGAKLLEKTERTGIYAEVVRTRHCSFAGRSDDGADSADTPVVQHILCLANDLRKSTTEIRYSQAPRLTYEQFLERAKTASGKTYAPYVVVLMEEPETTEHLKQELEAEYTEGYQMLFRMLKEADERKGATDG